MWAERRAIAVQAVGLAPASRELQLLVDRLNSQRGDQRSIIKSFAVSTLASGRPSTAYTTM